MRTHCKPNGTKNVFTVMSLHAMRRHGFCNVNAQA